MLVQIQHVLTKKRLILASASLLALSISGCSGKKPEELRSEPEPIDVVEEAVIEQPVPATETSVTSKEPSVNIRLRPNAPARYVVKKGDTLWDISTLYLQQPWLWPELWYFNPQIQNPHLIYPGDVLSLSYVNGRPQVSINGSEGEQVVTEYTDSSGKGVKKLSPKIYRRTLGEAIPTIPFGAIAPFMESSRIVGKDAFDGLPVLVGSLDNRVMAGPGTVIYVQGVKDKNLSRYDIVRKGRAFKHYRTGEVLGYEAVRIGKADLTKVANQNDLSTFVVSSSRREALRYDLLMEPGKEGVNSNMMPSVPKNPVKGSVIALHNAIAKVGTNQVIIVDLGIKDGIQVGNVLSLDQKGSIVRKRIEGSTRSQDIELPEVNAGMGLVFKVYEGLSYVLIVDSTRAINVGDIVRSPEFSEAR